MLNRRFALLAPLLIAALVAAPPAAAQQAADDRPPERSITVSGAGGVFADNDIATFSLGVSTRRTSAREALRSNSFAMRRIRGAVRDVGIEPKDLETSVVSLSRRTVGPPKRRRTVYVARNAVTVTIRDLDRAGDVVDAAVRAGATSVFGPEFGLADPQGLYREALGLAFADARAKAERLAREAGLTLGPALRIQESGAEEFDRSQPAQGGEEESPATVGAPPVSRGRTRITADVVVVFATS
ncbi:MAG TPA: SIMPL domain-containing protein [Solirubrobacteraceae bacterium]|nr:SIMPL domain-containing protein [Solirubrobacteraceae bacterium]